MRKIIHIDMDAFYASVEQHDHPELRGLPIAVGGAESRGVVCAASYEARRFGVRSAMPGAKARKLCPQLIFVPVNFDRYREVSRAIHGIFHDYTDIIEPISLDEAFLDVTENKVGEPIAVEIAREIRRRIREELGLTASAGVSYNKFLAKIASDARKPDGLCTIHPSQALDFIADLPVEAFWGVGRATAERMHLLGIRTGADLRERSLEQLTRHFGKAGRVFYDFARGVDERPVIYEWVRKSLGCERTFGENSAEPLVVEAHLREVVEELDGRLQRRQFSGRTLTLRVKFADFSPARLPSPKPSLRPSFFWSEAWSFFAALTMPTVPSASWDSPSRIRPRSFARGCGCSSGCPLPKTRSSQLADVRLRASGAFS